MSKVWIQRIVSKEKEQTNFVTTLNNTKLMNIFIDIYRLLFDLTKIQALYIQTASLTGIKVSQHGEYAYNARETVSVTVLLYKYTKHLNFRFLNVCAQLLKYHICTVRPGGSPASAHHVHLDVLLLLAGGDAAHLGHQPGVPHPHRAAVPEELSVVLLRVQGQVTRRLNRGKRDEYK